MATYSFLSVAAAINGPGGAFSLGSDAGAADEGISSAMVDEKDTTTPGAGGDLMHSLHASNLGTLTVRLLKTSPVNALLMAMYNFQRLAPSRWGRNTLRVVDVDRGDVCTGKQMAFTKAPDITWAKDGNTVEWVFRGLVEELLGSGIPDVNT